ncbi:MAG: SDR family oxidoreductase [Lachnospiraceae bacterium]|nr:SDR family oxidoreductase [Candidatus Merdinaster equi]
MSTYMIIGASSDLGCGLINEILKDDEAATIIATYGLHNDKLLEIKNREERANIKLVSVDLSDANAVDEFAEEYLVDGTDDELIPDVIYHFAADAYRYNRLTDWNPDKISRDMQIQVLSMGQILKRAMPLMNKKGAGTVVFTLSSVVGGAGVLANLSEYACVKYALLGLMRSATSDYVNQNVKVCAIAPSMIETKFVKGIGRKLREMSAEMSPLGRNLEVADVVPELLRLGKSGTHGEISYLPR